MGGATAGALFLGFGLASVIVAVPFLWRALPWKRLLAYSSLEHMGVVALGIGFGTPLAIAGVVIHVAGHGLAKALGFYAALPLLRGDPDAAHRAPAGVLSASRPTALAMGVSLGALAGLPPSPLFVSELLILLGGFAAGETAVAAVAAVALALGFLGLLHALLEGVIGEPGQPRRRARHRGERPIAVMTAALGAGMLALTVAAPAAAGLDLRGHPRTGRAVSVVDVETARWRDAVAARLADGARFAGAWAVGHDGAAEWRAALVGPDHETHVLGCARRRRPRPHDRRPRAGRRLGRARGPRSARAGLRRPRAAARAGRPSAGPGARG